MKIDEKMNNSFPQIWNETSRDQSLLFAWGAGSKDLKGDHMIFRGNVRGGGTWGILVMLQQNVPDPQ